MSKAKAPQKAQAPGKPHPQPLPRREGSGMLGCLFSCQLVHLSLVNYI